MDVAKKKKKKVLLQAAHKVRLAGPTNEDGKPAKVSPPFKQRLQGGSEGNSGVVNTTPSRFGGKSARGSFRFQLAPGGEGQTRIT